MNKSTRKFINRITWLGGLCHGWGNGYVAIHRSHPLFEKYYSDVENIEIHGGLTYSGELTKWELSAPNEWLDEIPAPDDISNWRVFGFDTAHGGDTQRNCTREYVISQTERLEKQLIERNSK